MLWQPLLLLALSSRSLPPLFLYPALVPCLCTCRWFFRSRLRCFLANFVFMHLFIICLCCTDCSLWWLPLFHGIGIYSFIYSLCFGMHFVRLLLHPFDLNLFICCSLRLRQFAICISLICFRCRWQPFGSSTLESPQRWTLMAHATRCTATLQIQG